MTRIPVVVTGIGATTPLGGTAPSTWEALLAGRSGVSRIKADWADELPVKIAAQALVEPTEVLDRVEARRLDRSAQFALVAALEAWRDAGYGLAEDNPVDRDRLGVSLGSGIGGMQTLLGNWDVLKDKGPRRVSPFAIPMLMANAPAANVSLKLGARAGVHTTVSACASSNESISVGLDMIQLGRADVVVVGGTVVVVDGGMAAGSGCQLRSWSPGLSGSWETRKSFPPAAGTRHTWMPPSPLLAAKAICAPSGDQAGLAPSDSWFGA